jgi:hypothetical protein
MLQRLDGHIADCHERAAEYRRRAGRANDAAMRKELLDPERSWRQLAASYEFVESLERFLLSARNNPIGTSTK